jgi:hypothetical protein
MASAMARVAARLPSQHTILLNKGNDEHRSSGVEQCRFNDDAGSSMIPIPFKLADDGKIESPCDLRKLAWYVAGICFNPACFG